MRAAWYERLGKAADVIEVGEMETPEAGPGELRIELAASGVNPSDVKRRGGALYTLEYPRVVPNSDGAGIVDQVGKGVSQKWLGKRVWLYNGQRAGRAFGTAAEYIALDAGLVRELPAGLSFAEGACLGVPGMTAYHAVFAHGPVEGKAVLVTGGAGAVGNYAVQLAKWGGAQVIATVSVPEKAAEAKRAGADRVLNYRTEDVAAAVMDATGGGGIDHIVETNFGANLPVTTKVLKVNGTMSIYASAGTGDVAFPFRFFMKHSIRLCLFSLNVLTLPERESAQDGMLRWLAEGERYHRVDRVFPLDQIAAAHERVESGEKFGTVIVQLGALPADG